LLQDWVYIRGFQDLYLSGCHANLSSLLTDMFFSNIREDSYLEETVLLSLITTAIHHQETPWLPDVMRI